MGVTAAVAGGSWEMVIFMVIMFFGVVYGYYTIKGSGIAQHPHGKIYSDSPGAKGPSNAFGRDESQSMSSWSRGTR